MSATPAHSQRADTHLLMACSTTPIARLCSVMTHTASHSAEELILNPDFYSDFHAGDLVQIYDPEKKKHRLILRVPPLQPSAVRFELSILKTVADSVNLKQFNRVIIDSITEEEAALDFVELSFKKQYLPRGNMLRFKSGLIGRTVHVNQNLSFSSMQAQSQDLRRETNQSFSGLITEKTKFVFRSKSARIIWLVQISAEMWDIDEKGEMYFEKFLKEFASPILDSWKSLGVSHMLTVIFFARTLYLDRISTNTHPDLFAKKSFKFNDGYYQQDFFKIVIENIADIDKVSQLKKLRHEFWTFAQSVGWKIPLTNCDGSGPLSGTKAGPSSGLCQAVGSSNNSITCAVPSDAIHGNLLEAINATLNILDKHYMDRDLQRTGNSIVMISAGAGVFKVKPNLSQISKQRMLDNAFGIDFISLSRPPVHAVPLFIVDCNSEGAKDFYEIPHWIRVSYVDCKPSASIIQEGEHNELIPRPILSVASESEHWEYVWSKEFMPHPPSAFLTSQIMYTDNLRTLLTAYVAALPFALKKLLHHINGNYDPLPISLTPISISAAASSKNEHSSGDQHHTSEKPLLSRAYSMKQHSPQKVSHAMPPALPPPTPQAHAGIRAGTPPIAQVQTQFQSVAQPPSVPFPSIPAPLSRGPSEEKVIVATTSAPSPSSSLSLNLALVGNTGSSTAPPALSNLGQGQGIAATTTDSFDEISNNKLTSPSTIPEISTWGKAPCKELQSSDAASNRRSLLNQSTKNTIYQHDVMSLKLAANARLTASSTASTAATATTGSSTTAANTSGGTGNNKLLAEILESIPILQRDRDGTMSSYGSIGSNLNDEGSTGTGEGNLSNTTSTSNGLNMMSSSYLGRSYGSTCEDSSFFQYVKGNSQDENSTIPARSSIMPAIDVEGTGERRSSSNQRSSQPSQSTGGNNASTFVPPSNLNLGYLLSLNAFENVLERKRLRDDLARGIIFAPPADQSATLLRDRLIEMMASHDQLVANGFCRTRSAAALALANGSSPSSSTSPPSSTMVSKDIARVVSLHDGNAAFNSFDNLPAAFPTQHQRRGSRVRGSSSGNENEIDSQQNTNKVVPQQSSTETSGTSSTPSTQSGNIPTPSNLSRQISGGSSSTLPGPSSATLPPPPGSGSSGKSGPQPITSALKRGSRFDMNRLDPRKASLLAQQQMQQQQQLQAAQAAQGQQGNSGPRVTIQSPPPNESTSTSKALADSLHEADRRLNQPKTVLSISNTHEDSSVEGKEEASSPGSAASVTKKNNKVTYRNFVARNQTVRPGGATSQQAMLSRSLLNGGGRRSDQPQNFVISHGKIIPVPVMDPNKKKMEENIEYLKAYAKQYSINPFRIKEGEKYLNSVTHNRRRWSHVFPEGKHDRVVDYGLNWKSLTQPAILPLNTDYLPTIKDLETNYSVLQYTISIDRQDSPFVSVEAALRELICQRLSREFQLIEGFDKSAYMRLNKYDFVGGTNTIAAASSSLLVNKTTPPGPGGLSAANSPIGVANKKIIAGTPLLGGSKQVSTVINAPTTAVVNTPDPLDNFYILTMGHRIHFLLGDVENSAIRVTQYVSLKSKISEEEQKENIESDRTMFQYRYEMWLPQMNRFQSVTQTFYQFPVPEFLWNKVDNIMMGDIAYDGIDEGKKPRNLKYLIIPPENMKTEKDLEDYYSKIDQFIEFMNRYAISKDKEDQMSIYKDRTMLPRSPWDDELFSHDRCRCSGCWNANMNAVSPIASSSVSANTGVPNTPNAGANSANVGTPNPVPPGTPATTGIVTTTDGKPSSTSNTTNNKPLKTPYHYYRQCNKQYSIFKCNMRGLPRHENPNWLYIKHDAVIYPFKAFHFFIHWFVCDSWLVDDFCNLLFRRCTKFGLRLSHIPGYFAQQNLNVHPFRPLPYIQVPNAIGTGSGSNVITNTSGAGSGASPLTATNAATSSSTGSASANGAILIPVNHSTPIRVIERIFFSRQHGWVFDSERQTEWNKIGLPLPNYPERDRDLLADDSTPVVPVAAAPTDSASTSTTSGIGSGFTASMKLTNIGSTITKSIQRITNTATGVKTTEDSNTTGTTSSSGSNADSSSNPLAFLRKGNNRLDRQYTHQLGIATVRMAATGFLWLPCANAKISDVTIPVEERTDMAMKLLRHLESFSVIAVDCYEIVLDVLDNVFLHADMREILVDCTNESIDVSIAAGGNYSGNASGIQSSLSSSSGSILLPLASGGFEYRPQHSFIEKSPMSGQGSAAQFASSTTTPVTPGDV